MWYWTGPFKFEAQRELSSSPHNFAQVRPTVLNTSFSENDSSSSDYEDSDQSDRDDNTNLAEDETGKVAEDYTYEQKKEMQKEFNEEMSSMMDMTKVRKHALNKKRSAWPSCCA